MYYKILNLKEGKDVCKPGFNFTNRKAAEDWLGMFIAHYGYFPGIADTEFNRLTNARREYYEIIEVDEQGELTDAS